MQAMQACACCACGAPVHAAAYAGRDRQVLSRLQRQPAALTCTRRPRLSVFVPAHSTRRALTGAVCCRLAAFRTLAGAFFAKQAPVCARAAESQAVTANADAGYIHRLTASSLEQREHFASEHGYPVDAPTFRHHVPADPKMAPPACTPCKPREKQLYFRAILQDDDDFPRSSRA